MGLRDRLKKRLGGLMGRSESPPPAPPAPRAAPPPVRASPPAPPKAPEAPPAPPKEAAKAPEPAPRAEGAGSAPSADDKARRAVEKARRGNLKHLAEQGGTMNMGDLHDYSERRYFIAHRAFSRLMEAWTEDGHVLYDGESGAVTLTEAGRAFMETPLP